MDMTQSTNEWSAVTLPSLGYYYGDRIPGGKILITPWTTMQEETLIKSGGSTDPIELLVKSNIKLPDPAFQYEDLIFTDEFFLFIQLRILSLCGSYTIRFHCKGCGKDDDGVLDLRTSPVKVPDTTFPKEPFEVILPKTKKVVTMRLQRVKDLRKIASYTGSVGKNIYRLARMMDTVDGRPLPFEEKVEWIKRLPLLDVRVIDNNMEKWLPGYAMTDTVKCPTCGKDSEVGIPQQATFFRPTDADISRESTVA